MEIASNEYEIYYRYGDGEERWWRGTEEAFMAWKDEPSKLGMPKIIFYKIRKRT